VIDKLKQLARSSLVYGLGNYGVKLVGFLLIPVYTRYLSPADYGVMALVSTFGQALFIFLNLGQSTALFRFYYEDDTAAGRQRVIAGSLWIVILISLPVALLALGAARPTAQALLGDAGLYPLVLIGVLTVACRQVLRLPFAVLRADERDTEYAAWSIARTALSAGLAIGLVVGLHLGVRGVLLGALVAEAVCCLVLLPRIVGALRVGWAGKEMREQLTFGLALVPGAMAGFVLELSDRFFLRHYGSLGEVGLYSLGYRFGEIMSFVVAAVQLAWPQFVFSNRRSPQAKALYSYATTYYLGGMLFLGLGLSMLAPEVIRIMAAPAFQRAAIVVPLITLAYLCEGLCYVGTIGIMLQRRPLVRSAAVAVAAAANIGLNFLLIPRYGMLGAAVATLLGFTLQALIQIAVALRYYPIPYQWHRFVRLGGLSAALYVASTFVPPASLPVAVMTKLLILASFPAILWITGLFEEAEVERVRRVGSGLRKRLVPSRAGT
jgi:O-antigen/teichoic acid export membrane protein